MVGCGPGVAGPGPGSGGQLGHPLLVALLAGGRLGLQLGLGVLQPGQPLGPTGQRLGQLVTTGWAVFTVFCLIGGRCLIEQLGGRQTALGGRLLNQLIRLRGLHGL